MFGTAGTLVVFRVGAHDAKRLAGELGMSSPATLTQTNNHRAWIKLMRDGAPLEARVLDTLAPRRRARVWRTSSPSRMRAT